MGARLYDSVQDGTSFLSDLVQGYPNPVIRNLRDCLVIEANRFGILVVLSSSPAVVCCPRLLAIVGNPTQQVSASLRTLVIFSPILRQLPRTRRRQHRLPKMFQDYPCFL